MVTFVGTQEEFWEAIESLVELDYAAIASYQEAIESVENVEYRRKLEAFRQDHERHIKECSALLKEQGKEDPTSAGIKQIFTQGKIMFANLMGDKAILKALKNNEDDTNTAYERLNLHPGKTYEASNILAKGLEDEQRHRSWLLKTIAMKEEALV